MLWPLRFAFRLVMRLKVIIVSVMAGMVVAFVLQLREQHQTWGVVARDAGKALAGDDIIADADIVETRTIMLEAAPSAVWPWLVQMGYGRGGWYSYDRLEQGVVFPVFEPSRVTAAPDGVEVTEISPVVGATDVVVVVSSSDPPLFFDKRTAATIPTTATRADDQPGELALFLFESRPPASRAMAVGLLGLSALAAFSASLPLLPRPSWLRRLSRPPRLSSAPGRCSPPRSSAAPRPASPRAPPGSSPPGPGNSCSSPGRSSPGRLQRRSSDRSPISRPAPAI